MNLVIIDLGNGLLTTQYQANTWTNADSLFIEHLETKQSIQKSRTPRT